MSDSPRPQGDHPQIPVRALLTIVGVMAIAVSLIWGVLQQLLPPEVIDPFEIPPPTPSLVVDGTPPASPVPDGPVVVPGSLQDLLAYAPDRLAQGDLPLNDIAAYADIAAWMNAEGVSQPANLSDPQVAQWQYELPNLALPTGLTERGLDPIFEQTYGFSLLDVDQVLVVGQAPDLLMIIRGRFSLKTQDAWSASGYQALAVDQQTYWTLAPGDRIDLSAPQSRPAMGTLNNIALLDNGLIVAATKSSRLEASVRVSFGNGNSLADRSDIQTLLAPGGGTETMVSAVLAKGALLQTLPQKAKKTEASFDLSLDAVMQNAIETQRLPPVDLVLIGIQPRTVINGPVATPLAVDDLMPRLLIVFIFDSADDATLASSIMKDRFRLLDSPITGLPYESRFGEATFLAGPGLDNDGRVAMTGYLRRGIADWQNILAERDFGFATWLANGT